MNKSNLVKENFDSFQRNIILSTVTFVLLSASVLYFGSKQSGIGLYHVDITFILLFASILNVSQIHCSFEDRIKAIADKKTKHPFYGKYWIFNLSFMHIVFGMIALVVAEIISVGLISLFNFLLSDILYYKFHFTLSSFASAGLGYFILFGFMILMVCEIPTQLKQFTQNSFKNTEA